MTADSIKELVKRLRDVETRERILGFGGSETLLLFSKEAADALKAMAGEVEAYESARVTWAESMSAWINRATVAKRERDRLAGEVASLQNTFDLMWKADQRAIKLWQEATGKDHIWPDRTKTTLWLLERAEAAESERDRLKEAIERNAQNCIDTMNKMHEQHAAECDRLKAALEAVCAIAYDHGSIAAIAHARKALMGGDAS